MLALRSLALRALTIVTLAPLGARVASAQSDYRNIDAGRPVRIGDATPTARRSMEISLGNGRVDKLSLDRYRLQLEPRVAYGVLPRTEIAIRSPIFFNERAALPRSGVAGVGVGGEYQLLLESRHLPALAVATEVFMPTGPEALPAAYSVKGLLTRSSRIARLHLNASYGTFSVRTPVGFEQIVPPIHGVCTMIGMDNDMPIRLMCSPGPQVSTNLAQAASPATRTHDRWLVGAAVDKTLPLRSILLLADVFAQKYRSIGRATDWTAEVGIRGQLTRTIVVDAALGHLFTGESRATFVTVGSTFSIPLKL